MGTNSLPPLPASARMGECPTLRLSRVQLLTLCVDHSAAPHDAPPPVTLRVPQPPSLSTPPRSYSSAVTSPPGLTHSSSALDTMASWSSPLNEVSVSSRASSPRKRRTEEDSSAQYSDSTGGAASTPSASVMEVPAPTQPTVEECIAIFQQQALSLPGTAANMVGWSHQLAQLAIKAGLLDPSQHGQVLLDAYATHTQLNSQQPDFQRVDDGSMDQSADGKESSSSPSPSPFTYCT
jgi:hypothetical protein